MNPAWRILIDAAVKPPHVLAVERTLAALNAAWVNRRERRTEAGLTMTSQRFLATARLGRNRLQRYLDFKAHKALYGVWE